MSQSKVSQANFIDMVQAVSAKRIETARKRLSEAYEARASIEREKDPSNHKIHDSLKASRSVLTKDAALQVLVAAETAPDFITQTSAEGKHYNVYAGQKVADLVQALHSGVIKNAINNAITRSLFKFRAAGEKFTGEMAKAAASDKIRVQGQIAKLLIRHTVSASTAPTQMSSTMQALQTLGIVKNVGTRREPVYELTDTPQTRRLEEIVAKAA